jgi:hypothetical protein
LATREIAVDFGDVDIEAGGNAFNYRNQLWAVRFAGGEKTEHRWCPILQAGVSRARRIPIQPDSPVARKRGFSINPG